MESNYDYKFDWKTRTWNLVPIDEIIKPDPSVSTPDYMTGRKERYSGFVGNGTPEGLVSEESGWVFPWNKPKVNFAEGRKRWKTGVGTQEDDDTLPPDPWDRKKSWGGRWSGPGGGGNTPMGKWWHAERGVDRMGRKLSRRGNVPRNIKMDPRKR